MTTPGDLRGLTQPDQRTCGPTALVAARMLLDPTYRPADPAAAALALHPQVTSVAGAGLPWPQALGTPPWAVARAMTTYAGRGYRTRVVRWDTRDLDPVRDAVTAGLPCPLFLGDRWLPRHVVLAVAPTGDGVLVFNPAGGTLRELTRTSYGAGRVTISSWTRPWFAVVPDRV